MKPVRVKKQAQTSVGQSMSNTGNRKSPLVADKRYTNKPAPQKAAAKPASRKPAKRTATPRGPIGWVIGAILGVFGFIFGLIWKLMWRGALVMSIILGIGIYYFASQMPPMESLIDGKGTVAVSAYVEEDPILEEMRIQVEVADTGAGIAAEDIDLIFNDFFTTKDEGTGLGLSNVRRLAAY